MVGLELGWRDEPDLAVKPSVVEPVDVFGDGDLNVDDGLPAALRARDRVADVLGLEQRVECLSHGVVVAVALRPDGCDGLGLGEPLGMANRSILDSSVAVVDQAGDVLTDAPPGPTGPCRGHQVPGRCAATWTPASRRSSG